MLRRATTTTSIALMTLLAAGTASANPLGYAIDTSSDLYSIDFATGTATLIGPLIGNQAALVEALAVSPSGQLFGTDSGGMLYSLNTNTGAATLIGNTSLGNVEGLDFSGTTLVGTNYDFTTTFYSINTSSLRRRR